MTALKQKIHVKQGNTVQEVTLYTTSEEASAYGTYGIARYNNSPCYYALGIGTNADTGSAYITPAKITKNGTTYYMLTEGNEAEAVETFLMSMGIISNETVTIKYTEPGESQKTVRINYDDGLYVRVKSGTTWTASITPNSGYTAGTLSPGLSGTVLSDTRFTITAEPVKYKMEDIVDYYTFAVSTINMSTILQSRPIIATNLISAAEMFRKGSALTTIQNFNLIDTSNVINMSAMFSSCSALTSVPTMNTSKVTNMYNMFADCRALTTIPEMNTSNVEDMGRMFYNCASLEGEFPWAIDCSNIGSGFSGPAMADMFYGTKITKVTLKNYNAPMGYYPTSSLLKGDDTLTIAYIRD